MGGGIDQFMWEWQPHFRISVQTTVERSLELVEARLDPRAFLIGFADDPSGARHPVCIEPETGPLQPAHLSGVQKRADEIYANDPERRILHSDQKLHESKQRWIRRRARGAAIAEAVEASGVMPGRCVLVSSAGHVAGFEVHTSVAVDRDPLEALPRLEGEDINRFPAPGSFVRHLIDLMLHEADLALDQRSPGMGAIRRRAEDLAAEAADEFAGGCVFRTRNFFLPRPVRAINRISQRFYEGAAASGRLLLVHPNQEDLEIVSRLARPISLNAARAVRKLLETTDENLALLVHEGGVFGLGRVGDADALDVFEIEVVAHATWELRTRGVALLRVAYGCPSLPTPIYDSARLMDALDRVLGASASVNVLLPLVSAAASARHGTTLVVSAEAAAEAERLAGQATLIEPAGLTPEVLTHYAKIDGAVLVDPNGVCHAIGVILDGHAEGQGDPARGARYNSAVRYQHSATAPAVVVVVSEDGDVVQVPSLRPRIRHQDVVDAMTLLEAASASDEPGQFADAYDHVQRLAFYLSPDQCARVNQLATQQEERTRTIGGITILRPPLVPDPTMDETYFLD